MRKVTLLDIGNLSRGKSKHRPRNDEILFGGNYPFVQTSDIKNANHILYKFEQTYNELGLKQSKLWNKNTICITIAANIAESAILGIDACFPDSVIGLEVNKEIADVHFVEYMLQNYKRILQYQSYGTSQENINLQTFEKVYFNIPTLSIQKSIAKILYSIDKKIELNNKINSELENLAKTLYEYWFVQFDFPDEFGRPYKSSGGKMIYNEKLKREVPVDWQVKNLFEVMDVQYGYPFNTDMFYEENNNNLIPVVRIRDILENTISAYSSEKVDDKYKLLERDLIIGMDGNFHMNFWKDNYSYLNQRSVRIRKNKQNNISTLQAYYELMPYIKARENNISRTTVGHLSDKDLKQLYIILPEINNNNNFNPTLIFESLLQKIITNRNETANFVELRDFLLPMLMNGQISVIDE